MDDIVPNALTAMAYNMPQHHNALKNFVKLLIYNLYPAAMQ